jgi:hypothetical protein
MRPDGSAGEGLQFVEIEAIACAGGAGSVRRLASYLLDANAEVGVERHWRHGRHVEGSLQQGDIGRGAC